MHIAPYLPALEAGVLTVMASFNSWNGEKCHGNRYLLTDVLKGRLGFDGFVDLRLGWRRLSLRGLRRSVAMAVNAGVDMFMVSVEWRQCIAQLLQARGERRDPDGAHRRRRAPHPHA